MKLQCLECGSTFDKDYKNKHEKTVHNGKKIATIHYGAPKNPFEAVKKKIKVSTYLIEFCIKKTVQCIYYYIVYLNDEW